MGVWAGRSGRGRNSPIAVLPVGEGRRGWNHGMVFKTDE